MNALTTWVRAAAILRAVARRVSLVNRTIVVFAIASIGIVGGAVAVPWIAFAQISRETRRGDFRTLVERFGENGGRGDPSLRLVTGDMLATGGTALLETFERFKREGESFEILIDTDVDAKPVHRYLRAVRRSTLQSLLQNRKTDLRPPTLPAPPDDPVEALLVIDRPASDLAALVRAKRQWTIVSAGLAVVALIAVYVVLVRRDLLRPVRRLRDTVEKVRRGEIGARSAIRTADDYQRLGESFNEMLDQFEQAQRQLQAINESLDLKLGELSEANVGLFESNRLKSEFLANVSHELRTPLNSIIGFAELLHELARTDPQADPKRARYISHILSSGRSLLDMINELLSMAKIEAGRMEVAVEPTSVSDLVEGIVTIMRPQASARRIEIGVRVPSGLPTVETDPGKLQQILYNFISNAIKFSPEGSEITISAERVFRAAGAAGVANAVSGAGGVGGASGGAVGGVGGASGGAVGGASGSSGSWGAGGTGGASGGAVGGASGSSGTWGAGGTGGASAVGIGAGAAGVAAGGAAGVRIAVHDQGPGIPYDMQETIFEKFRQVDASKTRSHSGTGLGLAICRELAQMLNATVGLASDPARGSTFFVELSFEFKGRELPPLMAEG